MRAKRLVQAKRRWSVVIPACQLQQMGQSWEGQEVDKGEPASGRRLLCGSTPAFQLCTHHVDGVLSTFLSGIDDFCRQRRCVAVVLISKVLVAGLKLGDHLVTTSASKLAEAPVLNWEQCYE